MTPEIKTNAVAVLSDALCKAMTRFTRAMPEHPSQPEWIDCIGDAAVKVGLMLSEDPSRFRRGPGRPRKQKKDVDVEVVSIKDATDA